MVDLTHARHDRAHVLAPGLFRSLKPGDRENLKVTVKYQFSDTEMIEFKCFEPLGVIDMRVLQGLVAMAGPEGLLLEDESRATDGGRQLMLALFDPAPEIREAREKPTSIIVRDSLSRLAREIGMDTSGKSLTRIRASIERLFTTSIFVQSGSKRTGSRLIAKYSSDVMTGDLYVALNPRLASAILGSGSHARIELTEARKLDSDPARLIHQRLSGFIDPGKSQVVSAEKLASYVWPDEAPTERTARSRITKVKKAIAEIQTSGWAVVEVRKAQWRFCRPNYKDENE